MANVGLTEYLMEFGLTRQEATIYLNLMERGMQTGYEVSKQTGISRSNVYRALAGLVEKGAAYTSEENATKYMGIDVEEFCSNKIRRMEQYKEILAVNMPKEHEETEGYLTVSGDEQIQHKIKNMLLSANKRVYLSMSAKNLKKFIPEISQLIEQKVKVVVLSYKAPDLLGIKFYLPENKEQQVGVITDSRNVLTGELGNGEYSTCLYSGQSNLVRVFKDSLKNEIKLIELTGGVK